MSYYSLEPSIYFRYIYRVYTGSRYEVSQYRWKHIFFRLLVLSILLRGALTAYMLQTKSPPWSEDSDILVYIFMTRYLKGDLMLYFAALCLFVYAGALDILVFHGFRDLENVLSILGGIFRFSRERLSLILIFTEYSRYNSAVRKLFRTFPALRQETFMNDFFMYKIVKKVFVLEKLLSFYCYCLRIALVLLKLIFCFRFSSYFFNWFLPLYFIDISLSLTVFDQVFRNSCFFAFYLLPVSLFFSKPFHELYLKLAFSSISCVRTKQLIDKYHRMYVHFLYEDSRLNQFCIRSFVPLALVFNVLCNIVILAQFMTRDFDAEFQFAGTMIFLMQLFFVFSVLRLLLNITYALNKCSPFVYRSTMTETNLHHRLRNCLFAEMVSHPLPFYFNLPIGPINASTILKCSIFYTSQILFVSTLLINNVTIELTFL